MYLGAKIQEMLLDPEVKIDSSHVTSLRRQFLAFYVELCTEIKSRINHKADIFHQLLPRS